MCKPGGRRGGRHVAAISAVHPRRTVATQIRPPRRGHAQMAAAAAARASHPQLLFYHDGRHPLIYMYEPPITSEQYQQAIDELIGTPVDGLCFCLGDGRTVLHATQVGERWGHHFTETGEQWSHDIFRRAAQNMEHLLASGVDPLRCVCERAAAKGLPIYPALLVNQGSGDSYVDDTRTSDFWLRSAHLRIGSKTTDMGALPMWFDQETSGRCLDFMHAEVRDERFALVEETLRSYACAGFELQLNYHTHYFHPSEVVKGCEVMTAWIKRCHTAVKASGADRLLIVRVPASLNGCRSRGLDVEAWLQLGIVDVLAAQVLSGPELHESSCPDFRALVAAADAAGGRCSVLATLQSHVDSDRVQEAPIEMVRGAACNYYAQGVHGLYLAHWFNNWPFEASFYEKLRELPDVDVMAPKDKIVFVSTETGRYSTSQLGAAALEPGLRLELPRFFRPSTLAPSSDSGTPAAALGSWPSSETPGTIVVHFSMSDDLPRAAAEERLFSVVLRVRVTGATELDRYRFVLNEDTVLLDVQDGEQVPHPAVHLRRINEMYTMSRPRYRPPGGYWFILRLLSPGSWPSQGSNSLAITLVSRDAHVLGEPGVRDVELETQYLKGRAFHRGMDRDLGPVVFDHAGGHGDVHPRL